MVNDKNTKVNKVVSYRQFASEDIQPGEIDLVEIWSVISVNKILVIIITLCFCIASVIYSLSLPNTYRASALLMPASESNSGNLANVAGQLGGLASLAGINIGNEGNNKTILTLEILKSRRFIENFIKRRKIEVPLIAAINWNIESSELVIDNDIFDQNTRQWVVKNYKSAELYPTKWELYTAFMEIFSISQDSETRMITLAIQHVSPVVATNWVQWLIEDINLTMKEKDKEESRKSIQYLTTKLKETNLADMQSVFYQLIEEQTKTMMLAEVSDEYVLKVVDPANVPDRKAGPNRPFIIILSSIFGSILAVLFVLIRYFY